MKKIALLGVNSFNPFLCGGVQNSMFELLLYLKRQGNEVVILSFFTREAHRCSLHRALMRSGIFKPMDGMDDRGEADLQGIRIHQELLPMGLEALHDGHRHGQVLKNILKSLALEEARFILTVEDDFTSLLSAAVSGLPGAHFFHSLPYIKNYRAQHPIFVDMLSRKAVFCVSRFLRDSLKKMTGIEADVWPPFIDFERYAGGGVSGWGGAIGYYSAGAHKGDKIVNALALKMPERSFRIMGGRYSCLSPVIPPNVRCLGNITEPRDFYSNLALLIVPSVVEEGFSRVILEAAHNGIPSIANAIGAIPEAVEDSGVLMELDLGRDIDAAGMADRYAGAIERLSVANESLFLLRQRALDRAGRYMVQQEKMSRLFYERCIKENPRSVPAELHP